MLDVQGLLPQNVAKAVEINKRMTKICIKRKPLPLIPVYSMTMRINQGQTLGKIIIDLVILPGSTVMSSFSFILFPT